MTSGVSTDAGPLDSDQQAVCSVAGKAGGGSLLRGKRRLAVARAGFSRRARHRLLYDTILPERWRSASCAAVACANETCAACWRASVFASVAAGRGHCRSDRGVLSIRAPRPLCYFWRNATSLALRLRAFAVRRRRYDAFATGGATSRTTAPTACLLLNGSKRRFLTASGRLQRQRISPLKRGQGAFCCE